MYQLIIIYLKVLVEFSTRNSEAAVKWKWLVTKYIQQNSFNPSCDNLEILTIQYSRRVVQRLRALKFCSFTGEEHQWNRQISGSCSKRALRMSFISHRGTNWPLASYSINFFSFEDSIKCRRGLWWFWTSRWRRYLDGILYIQSNGAVTTIYL